MKIYEWGDNEYWISSVIHKNKKKLIEHIKDITKDEPIWCGNKAFIWEIDTIKGTRRKILTIDL